MVADTSPSRILVVEDDVTTADLIALYLRHEGHRVDVVHSGDAAWGLLTEEKWDLLILDVMLPGVDGLELCKRAQETNRTPVILVTARTREEERIEGLDIGADDYVTKPFSPRELVARVGAVLRRAPPGDASALEHGPLRIDLHRRLAAVDGSVISLTSTEFDILVELTKRPGHVRDRARLLQLLPEGGRDTLERTVDVHIRNIRRKLEGAAVDARDLIETVSGVGYRLAARARHDAR